MSKALVFILLGLVSASEARAESYGSYSQCNKLKGGLKTQCTKCIAGGQYFNKNPRTKKWACGMTSDMHKSKALKDDPPPPKPKLSKWFSAYATIQPGTALMGSPDGEEGRDSNEQKSSVKVTRAFLMKTTEVTHNEWYNVMGTYHRVSYKPECGMDCPVNQLTWKEALEYLNKLSEREKLEPCYDLSGDMPTWTKGLSCKGYRLPTEAEWVLAARSGSKDARHGAVDDIAWHSDNSDGKVHPVATKKASSFGLYDMIGNVSEWTWDVYQYLTYDNNSTDPVRSKHDEKELALSLDRTVCGGTWGQGKHRARAAARMGQPANSTDDEIGFRPVRTK